MKKGRWSVIGYTIFLGLIGGTGFLVGRLNLGIMHWSDRRLGEVTVNGADILDIRSTESIDDFASGDSKIGGRSPSSVNSPSNTSSQSQSNVSVFEEDAVPDNADNGK